MCGVAYDLLRASHDRAAEKVNAAARAVGVAEFLLSTESRRNDRERLVALSDLIGDLRGQLGLSADDPLPMTRAYPPGPSGPSGGSGPAPSASPDPEGGDR